MSRWYHRYMNRPEKLCQEPRWRAPLSACVPGHVGDKRTTGVNRFDRWHKLPVAAHKLYWRLKERGVR